MPASDASLSLLLKAATPDLYRRNAFRLTGLPVTASTREVARQADKLKMLAELGGQAAQHLAVIPGMEPPTPEEVREATQRLKDVEARALDEFFWFWPEDWEKPESDEAFAAVKRNDLDAAFAIWAQRQDDKNSFIASRNLALIFHMRALEWAHLDLVEPLPKERVAKVAGYWKQSFDRWEWLADDDRHWEAFKARIRQVDDPALTTGFARRLRSELPQAFDKINAELALTYAEQGRRKDAEWHVTFLKSTHSGSDNVTATLDVVLAPTRARLERSMESAMQATQKDKRSGIAEAAKLLDAAEPLLSVFDMFHQTDSSERCHLFDEVAKTCLGCAVDGYNTTNTEAKEPSPLSVAGSPDARKLSKDRFIQVLSRAKALATDLELRRRLEQNIATARGDLQFETLIKPLLDKLVGIQQQQTTQPKERLRRIKNEIIPETEALISSGVLQEDARFMLSNSIAIVLRGIAISANNDFKQPAVGLEALTLAVKYARDQELLAQVKRDAETMIDNMAARGAQAGASTSDDRLNNGCLWVLVVGLVLGVISNMGGGSKNRPTSYPPSIPTAANPQPVSTPQPSYTSPRYVPPPPTYEPVKPMVSPPPALTPAVEPPKEVKTLADWQIEPDVWHTLRNQDDKVISAKVDSFDGTNVILTTGSNTHTYPVSKLSEASQQLVRELDRLRKRPQTGVLQGFVSPSYSTGPLTIKTRADSGDYYVKLVVKSTGITRMTIFIRGGATTDQIAVPSGTYELRYATGQNWHGDELLFGDETRYNKADSDFTFGSGSGYTVELFLQQFGNLNTNSINKDNF